MTAPSPGRPDDERPPSWMGAPGYSPHADDLPPHAPMPGAPPYPAEPENPPTAGRPSPRTGFGRALGASAVWAAVNLVLVIVVSGPPDGAGVGFVGGLAAVTLFAAAAVWLIARRRAWSFWLLVAVAAPLFWVLRAVVVNLPAA